MSKEPKKVSKGTITVAWMLLIVLICAAGGLTYLKFFSPPIDLGSGNAGRSTQTSPVIIETLNTIIDKFNVKNTENKDTDMTAILEETTTTIKVTYQEKTYDFKFTSPNLIIIADPTDENFKKVFSIIVYAVQKRLNNEINIDEHIKKFLEEDEEINGLSKVELEANKVEYHIDVTKKIGVEETTKEATNSTQETTETATASAAVGVITSGR